MMTTTARLGHRPRIADYPLTLGPDDAAQPDRLRWWAILGLNQ
jgi:hypothetical protein